MEKPKPKRLGKPFCDEQMLYLLQENGGSMCRIPLREMLSEQGYSKYCIYEAFRRNEWKARIWFEGPGTSSKQVVHLADGYDKDYV